MRVVSSLTGERNGKRDESSAIPDRRGPTSQVPTSMRCKSTRLARQMWNHQRETVYIFSLFSIFFSSMSRPCWDLTLVMFEIDIYIYIYIYSDGGNWMMGLLFGMLSCLANERLG